MSKLITDMLALRHMKFQDPDGGKRFKTWLGEHGLSYQAFAMATGNSISTVQKWALGAIPRKAYKALIAAKYPDCPLVKEER